MSHDEYCTERQVNEMPKIKKKESEKIRSGFLDSLISEKSSDVEFLQEFYGKKEQNGGFR